MTSNPWMMDRCRLDMLYYIKNKGSREYYSKSGKILVDIVYNICCYTYRSRPYTPCIYLSIENLAGCILSNFLHSFYIYFQPCLNNSFEDIQ
jgi:hypothetical protein